MCMHIHGVGYDTRDAYKHNKIIYAQLPNKWGGIIGEPEFGGGGK